LEDITTFPIYDPVLVTAESHKNDIFALLLHMRPEAEVLCEPTIISIEPIKV
jgi:hypothetical protein